MKEEYTKKQAVIGAIIALLIGGAVAAFNGTANQASFFGPSPVQPEPVEYGILDAPHSATQGDTIKVGTILKKDTITPADIYYNFELDGETLKSGKLFFEAGRQQLDKINLTIPAQKEPGIYDLTFEIRGQTVEGTPIEPRQFEDIKTSLVIKPAEDSDKDDLNNIVDECPETYGSKENGCPTTRDKFFNLLFKLGLDIR